MTDHRTCYWHAGRDVVLTEDETRRAFSHLLVELGISRAEFRKTAGLSNVGVFLRGDRSTTGYTCDLVCERFHEFDKWIRFVKTGSLDGGLPWDVFCAEP